MRPGYTANSLLWKQLLFAEGGATRLTTTKDYDLLNRLKSISSVQSKYPMPVSFTNEFNISGQRDIVRLSDGSYWDYDYDDLGQLTSGKRRWQTPTTAWVAGQQYEYAFDDIGNRTQAKVGGDSAGGSLRTASYSANRLNQYESRQAAKAVDVVGLAPASQAVTVGGVTAARAGEYFHRAVPLSGSSAQYTSISVVAGTESSSGSVYSPGSPLTPAVLRTGSSRLRTDFGGFVGMKFTVGATPLVVSTLGRMMFEGNTASHIVKLVRASDGQDVTGGSVTLNMSGGVVGTFKYAQLASPVELAANTSYYLVTQEAEGGDAWHDYNCGVTTTSAITVNHAVYWMGGVWNASGYNGHCYGPVSFQYVDSSEFFEHDLDGNLVRDGRWNYTWDAENRLVKMESFANAPTGSKRRFEFAYDHQGRRIWKKVTNLDTPAVTAERKFLYDGWNLIAELDGAGTVLRKYVWGLDLSGSFQGAGGVGGLLKIVDTALGSHFCAYDGNGNLSALVKAADGDVSAQYEYGPFGELIRATGPATGSMAKANPFRFSTKYQDDETDLLYYGYRYYSASMGRWVSRDPISERGGLNVYAFVRNKPLSKVDLHGKIWTDPDGGRGPRPVPVPSVPSGPCPTQQILGGPEFPEVQETEWFNANYSGWIGHAKSEYGKMISDAIEAQCGERRSPNLPRLSVYPYYSDSCLCTRTAGGGNETDYGDKPQSRFGAGCVLGSFVFMIEGPVRVSFSDDSSLCCLNGGKMKHYRWDADLIVYDVLGFQPEDVGYWVSLGSCPERGLVRARWRLNGTGVCCTAPKL